MPACDYCEQSFDDEQSYLEHLAEDHEDELGTIDRRRVEEAVGTGADDDGLPTGPLILGVVILFAAALVVYVLFFLGSSGQSGTVNGINVVQLPDSAGTAHEHGLINVTIEGETVDFSQSEYQRQADPFHFEGGDGRVWHKHATGVTLEYAMATLGFDVSADSVTVDGTTYRESDENTTVNVTVNGDPVEPDRYELQGASDDNPEAGDFIRIIVETNETS